jgi:CHAD domain-containing protein
MATEVTETERKYEAEPGAPLPDLTELPMVAAQEEPAEQTLRAEYFDTADLRLIRGGITLRRRRGGTDAGWHLKLPAGPDSRTEIRLPLGRAVRKVPAELAALVRAQARGGELRPVALITTTRRLRVLLDDTGASLAEVAVDEVSAEAMGEAAALSRWNEVEVELTGGDTRLLNAVDKRLRHGGLRPSGRQAKLERALAGQLPPETSPPELSPRSPAADVALAYAAAQVAALTALDPQVRRDQADSVHKMRVAGRRLRATLRSFDTVLLRARTRQLSAELTWLGSVLGAARDAEVLAARLQSDLDQLPAELVLGPASARLREHFAPVEAAAREAVLAALNSDRYLTLLSGLDTLLADPPLAPDARLPAAKLIPAAVRRARRRVRTRMRRAWETPAGPARDAALHETRKAAKDARYAAEAASAAFGRDAARLATRMKEVQSVLGDHHDSVVARSTVRDLAIAAGLAGENAFSFGILYEQDADRARALEHQAQEALAGAFEPRASRWLG